MKIKDFTYLRVLAFFIVIPVFALSQKYTAPLTRGELDHALNNAFNKLVAGNPNSGEISNYATLDPINANFNIKSSIPIRSKEKPQGTQTDIDWVENRDKARISYLSLSVSGALIDKQYSVLFSDSKLNSGISFSAQYNFGMKANHFKYFTSEWDEISAKRDNLRRKYTNDLAAILDATNYEAYQRSFYLLSLQQISARDKLSKKKEQQQLTQKSVDSLGNAILSRIGLADTLRTLEKDVSDLVMEIRTTQYTIDSIHKLSEADINGHSSLLRSDLLKKYKNDYDTLLSVVPFQTFPATWFTIIAEYNRKSYNTFDITLPFALQIKEANKTDEYKFGFAINRLVQNKLTRRTLFLNGGVAWIYKSNLDQLTATSIEQQKQYTNSGGDTSRTITKNYSVYSVPVKCLGGLNIAGHVYYIFGKTPSGFHFFPSLDIQNKRGVFNCTFGYIIAFKNTVKDQPILNTEFYIRFNDISNNANIESKFYKRNEIGISFTIPFNIF